MCLVLPLLLFLAMGLVEYGQYFYVKSAFEAAARDAARQAMRGTSAAGDPAAAATSALAAANVTFNPSWMSIYDEYDGSAVADVSQVAPGHPLKVCISTTIDQIPAACRPLFNLTGRGLQNNKVLWGQSTMVKE